MINHFRCDPEISFISIKKQVQSQLEDASWIKIRSRC